jgi:hypothetical protein
MAAAKTIRQATDASYVQLFGGSGATDLTRGAALNVSGGVNGSVDLYGSSPNGRLNFGPGGGIKGIMFPSGGFAWNGTVDPGAGAFVVGVGGRIAGQAFIDLNPAGNGVLALGVPSSLTSNQIIFSNPGGFAGYIQTTGTTTTYATSSDARLKTDRGPLLDLDVLRNTRVRRFTWTADGTPGRGVFAQEAAAVAPFAVTIGSDARDDQGRLTNPWGVDYAKYVPDLIVGWQHHEAEVAALRARVVCLEDAAVGARARSSGPRFSALAQWVRGWFAPRRPVKA